MKRLILVLVVSLFLPLSTHAQAPPAQWNIVTVDLLDMNQLLDIAAYLDSDELAVNNPLFGGRSYRVDAARNLTPVTCVGLTRPANAARQSPYLTGLSPAGILVGDDEELTTSGNSRTVGVLITADGTCTVIRYGVSTRLTGIASTPSGTYVVGEYADAPGIPGMGGLLRFHGFILANGVRTLLNDPASNNRDTPTGWNAAGQVIGWGRHNIQVPQNTYTYAAWICKDGMCEPLVAPNGREVCPVAINDAGAVLLTRGACNSVEAGTALWYNSATREYTELPLPPDAVFLEATTLTEGGAFGGRYTVKIATGFPPPNDYRYETHGFLALPDVAPTPTGPPEEPPATKERPPHEKKAHEKKGKEDKGPRK